MTYDFNNFKKASDSALEWIKGEYTGIRTGRAAPSILDNVSVSAYNSKMSIKELASVSIDGPKSLRVTPWDKSLSHAIDSAIRESNLGLSVSMDDEGLRISFPDLSSERRVQLEKLAKEKFEEARIRIRNEREKSLKDFDSDEFSKDDKFRLKNELQKLVDEANEKFESLYENKTKEIRE